MFKPALVLISAAAFISSALASSIRELGTEFGSTDEARAMLDRAIAEVKTSKSEAITKFNHNDPRFRDRDLFVFCFDAQDGKFTAHEAMVARDVRTFQDRTGKWYGDEIYSKAEEDRVIEVTFLSPVPGSTELTSKIAYVTRIRDQVCGVSAYPRNATGGSSSSEAP